MMYCNTAGSVADISEMVIQPKYPHYIQAHNILHLRKLPPKDVRLLVKENSVSLQYEPAMRQPNTSTNAAHEPTAANNTITSEVYSTPVSEALLIGYCLHELPTETVSSCDYRNDTFVVDGACSSTSVTAPAEETQGLVHAALKQIPI